MYPKLATLLLLGSLVGCGTTPQDRALGGAGIGAGGGALLGAVTGLTLIEGAAIGAAAGALTGVLTDRGQIDLGGPLWKRGSDTPESGDATVTRVQSALARLGYDPGPVDGRAGPRTARAIRDYQRTHGLLVDGSASPALAAHLERQRGG